MVNDPISDVLTRVKNASNAKHKTLIVHYSGVVASLLEVMKEEGYIKDFEALEIEGKKYLRIQLRYNNNREAYIIGVRRISRPGRRIYADKENLPRVLDGLGTAIISTSKGIMSDKKARKLGVGGEVICFIW